MRVALVYDRLNKIGGAEVVLTQFAELFPNADWYTSVYDADKAAFAKGWKIHTSWLQHIPPLRTHHEWIPYLMPFVFESFDFSHYDLVISVGSAEAKGIITKPGTTHLNYCLTPTRYLYSHRAEYLSNRLYRWIGRYLRAWDLVASTRPDEMIAISTQVKKRIKNIYKRDVAIVFPPVNIDKFTNPSKFIPEWSNYYLTVARLVDYKRIDILIDAFNENGKTLVIVGTGTSYKDLKKRARPNIHFTGLVAEAQLVGYYEHCLAFIQANEEDFGIAMCECLASGHPVIAYAHGGAADIVQDKINGLLVKRQTSAAFNQAVDTFETMTFTSSNCVQSAKRFTIDLWKKSIKERINKVCH